MQFAEAVTLLGSGQVAGGRKDQYLTTCPSCGEYSFYFAWRKERGQCKRGSCKLRRGIALRNLRALLKGSFRPRKTQAVEKATAFDPVPPSGLRTALDCPETYAYLLQRGVPEGHIAKLECLGSTTPPRLVLGVDNVVTGEVSPYVRSRGNEFFRWMGQPGFQRDHHVFGASYIPRESSTVILVEGPFDVLSPGLLGMAISTLGAACSDVVTAWLARRFSRVWVWPDNDVAGKTYEEELHKKLRYWGLETLSLAKAYKYTPDKKDPGDFRPADIAPSTIRKKWNERFDSDRGYTPPQFSLREHIVALPADDVRHHEDFGEV